MSEQINKVAVLGAGTMGAQIAGHFSNAGIPSLYWNLSKDKKQMIQYMICLQKLVEMF